MSRVTCHVSRVTCQVSGVRWQVSFVRWCVLFCLFLILQSGGASRWRVCYQRGLPRLVFTDLESQQPGFSEFVKLLGVQNILGAVLPFEEISSFLRLVIRINALDTNIKNCNCCCVNFSFYYVQIIKNEIRGPVPILLGSSKQVTIVYFNKQ